MNYNVYEPHPKDNRASFYGKCHVIEVDHRLKFVYSYNTLVALIVDDVKLYKLYSGYSQTTMRHIKSVFDINKSEWDILPISVVKDVIEAHGYSWTEIYETMAKSLYD